MDIKCTVRHYQKLDGDEFDSELLHEHEPETCEYNGEVYELENAFKGIDQLWADVQPNKDKIQAIINFLDIKFENWQDLMSI